MMLNYWLRVLAAAFIQDVRILINCPVWRHTYYGSPFPPHAQLPVEREHFNRWMALFAEIIDEYFPGKIADRALCRSGKWGRDFLI